MSDESQIAINQAIEDAINAFVDGLNKYRSDTQLTPEESEKLRKALKTDEVYDCDNLPKLLEQTFSRTMPKTYIRYFSHSKKTVD